jgi:anti-sigma regulatory factor (Ser/Thr protein kinase)
MDRSHAADEWVPDKVTFQGGLIGWVILASAGALLAVLIAALLLARRQAIHRRLPARVESIRWLGAVLTRIGREANLSERAIYQCRLALDEACANIIRHAYDNDPQGEIEAYIQARDGMCTIHLTDFGKPYDPAHVNLPHDNVSIDDTRPGGLGLHLMRTVMDEVHYTPGPHGNRLVMVKRREEDAQAHSSGGR